MATFADYLTDGSGEPSFRLVIEGCPYIFITDPRMECAMDDGRIVVRGLLMGDLAIRERARMATAELDVSLGSIRISETDGPYIDAATRAFTSYTSDSLIGYLATGTAVTYSDTSASVRSDAGFSVGQRVHIGTEVWKVTGVTPSGSTAASTIAIDRGEWDTTPQSFAATFTSTSRVSDSLNEITSAPGGYAGRRFWLYGHGSSELALDTADSTTTGTLLYRGILAQDPELSDSGTWSLSIQPRLGLFDQEVGAGLDSKTALRGIYYPAAGPLMIVMTRYSGANKYTSATDTYTFQFYGFFPSQGAFCTALALALNADATLAAWGGTWDVVEGDQWELYYTAPASPRFISIEGAASNCDGRWTGVWMIGGTNEISTADWVSGSQYRAQWDAAVYASAVADRHVNDVPPLEQMRRVPRAHYFRRSNRISSADETAAPFQRFYLDSAAPYIVHGTITLTTPTNDGTDGARGFAAVDGYGSDGYIETSSYLPDAFCASGDFQPTIELGVFYGPFGGGTLAEFVADIVAQAPTVGNNGGPFITSDDVADWTSEVSAALGGRSFLQRRYYLFSRPKKLIDVLREECKLHSLYMYLDADGKVAVRRLPTPDSRTPSFVIDDAVLTPGEDFGQMKLAEDGVVSRVEFSAGYSSAEDKWTSEFNFVATGGAQVTKSKGKTIKIAPYVRPRPWSRERDAEYTSSDAQLIVDRLLATFGRLYYTIDIDVSMKAHGVRIGDAVLVSVPQLPFAGVRRMNATTGGLTNLRAWVVGRQWLYGDEPGGSLTLLVLASNTAGYAPSAWVESATGAGTSWALTCTHAKYGDGSRADASYFEAGFRVRLREWDSDTPVIRTGTVSSVVGDVVNVTLDDAWSGYGSAFGYVLGFARANEGITDAQKLYTYMADPTGRIAYIDGTSSPSRVFA